MSRVRRIYGFQLIPRIDDDNQLVLTVNDGEDSFQVSRIDQLLDSKHDDADALTLRVSDFYHKETVYKVYGIVLDADTRTISAYWSPIPQGTGIEHIFEMTGEVTGESPGRLPTFVIGARPCKSGVPEPRPASTGGPFPGALDERGAGGDG